MEEEQEYKIERLDQYVSRVADVSRSVSVHLIKTGKIKVDREVQTKPSYKIKLGDKISLPKEQMEPIVIPKIELPVIYEDGNVVVINKPVGVLTHSKGTYNPEPTVATWLEDRAPGMSGNRAGIVHRLDRATSGVMILAKNPDTLSMLQKQFSQRKTKKAYEAIIVGSLPNPEANIDMPIERNPKKPQTFRVGVNGKTAQTYYKTVKTNDKYSLLELKPVTGRTHQLRVHLKQLDHPIVGDTLYGGKVADRLYLHAKSLEITVPGSQRKVFDAEVPKEFDQLLK